MAEEPSYKLPHSALWEHICKIKYCRRQTNYARLLG